MATAAQDNQGNTTRRFREKRDLILEAATDLINELGVKGMTFVDVAERVQLNTTSITYYFKRKEMLAQAVFDRALDQLDAMVSAAAAMPDARARVRRLIALNFEHEAAMRRGEAKNTARLSDMRAMAEPMRTHLAKRYVVIARKVRHFFGTEESQPGRAINIARAHVLTENLYWLPAWITGYSPWDFARVEARLFEAFERGFAGPEAVWAPHVFTLDAPLEKGDAGPEAFLRAATRLINELGYRGASVERIASELSVTKGSFYHHLDTKDDLVLNCFDRSYLRVSQVQRRAAELEHSAWDQLSSAIATLLGYQFGGDFPLLRSSALQALPQELRDSMIERSNRTARRFAGMLVDGITEGSIRAIDPLIVSQMLMASINASFELRSWASNLDPDQATDYYARIMAFGLFRDIA